MVSARRVSNKTVATAPPCKDMVKFGGSGRSKQCCKERRCPNMMLADAEVEADEEEVVEKIKELRDAAAVATRSHRVRKSVHSLSWTGGEITQSSSAKRVYYEGASVDDMVLVRGDCIEVKPDSDSETPYVARIMSFFQDSKNEKMVHVDWYCRGPDTVLGETSDTRELFTIDDCEDIPLASVTKKVRVVLHKPSPNWSMLGGIPNPEDLYPLAADDTDSFYTQLNYEPQTARFEYLLDSVDIDDKADISCLSCMRTQKTQLKEKCILGEAVPDSKNHYSGVSFLDETFKIGDAVLLDPSAYGFKTEPALEETQVNNAFGLKDINDEKYPEFYRINFDKKFKGSNDDTSEPFRVARIVSIKVKNTLYHSEGQAMAPTSVSAVIRKYYRPENTHRGKAALHQASLNLLYWSEDEVCVPFSFVCGKCYVMYGENMDTTEDEFFLNGPHRFIFDQAYDPDAQKFYNPSDEACKLGNSCKGKGKGKGKGKSVVKKSPESRSDSYPSYPAISRKLKTLDVFSGCGGLSEGFHQAGVAISSWAIEVFEPAANAYKLNNPCATVFTDDCNLLLRMVMDGETVNDKGQCLPLKGDVELLCGGPPCQGFSGMNRFNSRQYSQFKNSLVSSYLSYCDFYRPKYFLLENVRNFVSYKCSMVLRLTLRALVSMGYQCTFGILQAGSYGVSQTRRRAIILAAAPGEQLPFYPEPLHSFAPRACTLSAAVGDVRYQSNCRWNVCGPLRTITVRDALSDLPTIANGGGSERVSYTIAPESHFQRLIRGCHSSSEASILQDHMCKNLSNLVEARMRHIPTDPGSDWRKLPNISVRLNDGSWTRKL